MSKFRLTITRTLLVAGLVLFTTVSAASGSGVNSVASSSLTKIDPHPGLKGAAKLNNVKSLPVFSTGMGQSVTGQGSPLINDALPLPPEVQANKSNARNLMASSTVSQAPGRYDTSTFMTGTVAVGIVLPESTGSGENWSTARQTTVVNEIKAGMDWWKAHASAGVNLNFVYDQQLSVSTTYEPITLSSNQENLWIKQVMTNLGYTDTNYVEQVYSYDAYLRSHYNTDWAFTIFVVDSLNDSDGMFSNGYFAYAYLGGPFMIMTYDNDGWGITNMNWVATHETGHIFGAGDQYYQPGYGGCTSTTEKYGYLGVVNSNCEYNNPASVPSIMRSNEDALEPTAAGQIGWKDSNSNSVMDVIDTFPGITLAHRTSIPAPVALTYSGTAYDTAWPHAVCGSGDSCNVHDVDANKVVSVQYRVDGSGPWLNAAAGDGSFNSDFEAFSFTTAVLGVGAHTIDLTVTNTVGRTATWQDNLTVQGGKTLTVSKTGSGTGTITSSPTGINCGATCSAIFNPDSTITLTATPTSSLYRFNGWTGAGCSGTGTCVVTMSADQSVSAEFVSTTLTVSKTGTGSGTVTSAPAGINCGATCSAIFNPDSTVTLTATPTSNYHRFVGWTGGGCSGTGTCVVTMSTDQMVSAQFEASTFNDVPFDHPLYSYIQALWNGGYTAGCQSPPENPIKSYCPDQILTRAMSAVFMLRGNFGNTYTPPPAPWNTFNDDWSPGTWAEAWAEGMWVEGLTAGCQFPPDNPIKLFCPWDQLPKEQASVFGVRMMHGMTYIPNAATGLFADMTDLNYWATPWAEQAYTDGLLPNCGTQGGKPLFCPSALVNRAWAAYMVVKAKNLPLP